jgi:hypothetical protein
MMNVREPCQLANDLPELVRLAMHIANDSYGTVNSLGNRRHY